MSARDRRAVGELLATATRWLERRYLTCRLIKPRAIVRTWSRVVVSAARLWVLPPAIPTTVGSGPHFDQAVWPPGGSKLWDSACGSRRCDERALVFVRYRRIDNRAGIVVARGDWGFGLDDIEEEVR